MTDVADLAIRAKSDDVDRASDRLDRLERSAEKAERGADKLAKKTDMVGGAMRRLATIAGGVAGALIATFGSRAVINAADAYETRTARIDAILRATGHTAGRTARQLEDQAQSLARATLESVDGIRNAQQVLLTFRNVQGEVFDRAIEGAADLAAAMGTDVTSATRQLARALEDPIQGVSALTRSGTVFTQQQREMIRSLVESGRTLDAQKMILAELEGQYGGASRAASSYAQAKDSLGQSANNLAIAMGGLVTSSALVLSAMGGLDSALQFLAENIDLAVGGITGLAVAIGAKYIPLVYSAIAATGGWIAALAVLKSALIATGIGAIAVGIGVIIAYLVRVREATGSWGETFRLVGAVISESLNRAGQRLLAFGQEVSASANLIRSGFLDAAASVVEGVSGAISGVGGFITSVINMAIQGVAKMVNAAIEGLNAVIELANKIRGVDISTIGEFSPSEFGGFSGGISGGIDGIASSLRGMSADARQASIDQRAYGEILTELSGRPLESVNALREAMAGANEDTIDLTGSVQGLNEALAGGGGGSGGGSGGGGGGSGGGGAGGLAQLAEDRKSMMETILQDTSSFFGDLMSLTGRSYSGLERLQKAFAAKQALVNTYLAASQALADPSLGFFAKFAAVAKVVAAGMGLVNAIKSGGGSRGGGGGGSVGAAPQQSAPAPARDVRVNVQGEGMFADYLRQHGQEIFDAVLNEGSNRGTKVILT